jgi:hypothetical protein
MAVANSVTQIVLPGIDKTVRDNSDVALNENLTIEAIQTNLSISGDINELNNSVSVLNSAVSELPQKEAYPTFATYSNYSNEPHWNIYDSNMQPVSNGSQDTNAELWSPWTSNNYTNSNPGTSSWTSNYMGSTCFNQADAHWYLRLNEGNRTYTASNPDVQDSWIPYWGVIIGQPGVRQKFSLWQSNATLRVMARGVMTGYYETLSLNSTTYATWFGGTSYGMVGYNDRTRTLVAMEAKDTSNNYRMHIWKNTGTDRSLNVSNYHTGTLHLFLSEAKSGLTEGGDASYEFKDFQWQANSSQSYNESRYRIRVIPGDNGVVGLARFVPSNVTHYATYTPSTSTLLTSYNTISLTTSYGIDSGGKYGMRHQITWNNKWVAAYSQYHFYSNGINVFFIDSYDPRNYFVGQNADTNNGCQLVPYKEDKFMFNRSVENANSPDGSGIRLYIIDPQGAANGRLTNSTIATGGTIPLTANQMIGIFDTRYTSTLYPVLVSMPHWKVNK